MIEPEALVISAAIEGILGYAVARLAGWRCRGPGHVAAACMVATAVTHPQIWTLAQWAYPRWGVWPSMAAIELAVVVVEGALVAWMSGLRLDRALGVSLLANAGSFLLGLAIGG